MITIAALLATASLAKIVGAYLAPLVKSGDFNGVVVVARGDKVLVQEAYGKADWDLDARLTPRSRFRIASITKTFTAASIVMLVERGKVALDDPLSKYIPDFPNGEKIKIRQLLLHRSGVPNPDSNPCSSATLDDLVAELAKKPLWFEPGKRGAYSNGGYALLARVVEKASGLTWEQFLRENLFKPLALGDTEVDRQLDVMPMRTRGYAPGPGAAGVQHVACEGAWAAFGSGAIVSSAADLYRWGRAVRNDVPFKRSALEYAYGWGERKYFEKRAIEQSGIVSGFSSYLAVYPDDDLYVVVLSNLQSAALNDIGKGLAALALGIEAPKLTPSPALVASSAEERKRWLGRYKNETIATIELTERNGALYLRWGNSPETVFIGSTGPSTAYNRQDAIAMELTADGSAIRMTWSGGEPQEFKRIP